MSSLRLNQITADDDIQPRAKGLDQKHVDELAEAVKAGAKLPPVVVYDVGETHLLSEGFHRYAAFTLLKKTHIPCEVRKGTREECKLNALASNQSHGLKRTNADKLRALEEVLKIVAHHKPKWSDGKIADFIGVSRNFVNENRPQLSSDDSVESQSEDDKVIGKDGKEYPKKTSESRRQVSSDDTSKVAKSTKTSESAPEPVADPKPDDTADTPTEVVGTPPEPTPAEPVKQVEPEPEGEAEQEDTSDPSEAFCDLVAQICRDIDAINARVVDLKESPYGRFIHWQGVRDHIKAGRESLWQARPMYHCPYCKKAGEVQPGCRCCGGLNVCTKQSYKAGVAAVGGGDE